MIGTKEEHGEERHAHLIVHLHCQETFQQEK